MGFFLRTEFYTERWAKIEDKRLGYAYSLGWWATLLVGFWSLFVEGGYLELDEELRGVIRPRLNNRPTAAYHNEGSAGKFSPALRTGGEVPDYCQSKGIANVVGRDKTPISCEQWDPLSVSRQMGPAGIFVATRLQERQEVSVCSPRAKARVDTVGDAVGESKSDWGRLPGPTRHLCHDGFQTEWVRQAFLEGVEDFILKASGNIEAHAFARASTICGDQLNWKHENKELDGLLVGRDGEPLPGGRGLSPPDHVDAFALSLWLEAAGVISLDNKTDASGSKPGLDTVRHEGMVLEVSYEYSNTDVVSFFDALVARIACTEPAPFTYKIRVERVAGSEFKLEEVVSHKQSCDLSCPPETTEDDRVSGSKQQFGREVCCGTGRVVHRLHGLLIKFGHSGHAGQFSFTAIPSHLIYSLGSVTLIKAALDLVWSVLFKKLSLADYTDDIHKKAVKTPGSGKSGFWKGVKAAFAPWGVLAKPHSN